ncbi:hypothetical protein Nmel_014025 [Mimus melanotis]
MLLCCICNKFSPFLQCNKCFVAVPGGHDGGAGSGGSVVPAVSESVVPENTQPPAACTKPSKWGKFLALSDNANEKAAAVTTALQEGSGGVGLDSTAASGAWRGSGQAERTLPQNSEFKKCVASSEDLAWRLPSSSCSVEDEFREHHSQVLGVGAAAETTAGKCCLDTRGRANTFVNSNPWPKPSNVSCQQLFCTGEEFDDDFL